ncbi:hypothetical protein QTN25_006518 [Entamoeba marina]
MSTPLVNQNQSSIPSNDDIVSSFYNNSTYSIGSSHNHLNEPSAIPEPTFIPQPDMVSSSHTNVQPLTTISIPPPGFVESQNNTYIVPPVAPNDVNTQSTTQTDYDKKLQMTISSHLVKNKPLDNDVLHYYDSVHLSSENNPQDIANILSEYPRSVDDEINIDNNDNVPSERVRLFVILLMLLAFLLFPLYIIIFFFFRKNKSRRVRRLANASLVLFVAQIIFSLIVLVLCYW